MKEDMNLRLSKWGNSSAIRIPKKVLNELGMSEDDKFSYKIENGKLILKPDEVSPLRKMFEGFDTEAYFADQKGDKEEDWGAPVGKEDF